MKMEDAKMVVNWTKIYAADPTQFIGKCECNLSISSYVKKFDDKTETNLENSSE